MNYATKLIKQKASAFNTESGREVIAKMIRKADIQPNEKVAVAFWDSPKIVSAVLQEQPKCSVYYIEDSKFKGLWNTVNNSIYVNNKVGEYFPDMEFDKIIINPPYNFGPKDSSNPYIKIVCEALKHTSVLINLSPGNGFYNDNNIQIKAEIEKYFCDYERAGDDGFNASFDKNLYITKFDKNCKEHKKFEELRLSNYDNPVLAKSICDKLKTYDRKAKDRIEKYEKSVNYKFNCYIPTARGHRTESGVLKWDWTTLFPPEIKYEFESYKGTAKDVGRVFIVGFDTKEECFNFVNYFDSDIVMFAIHLNKTSKNINIKFVPDMPTYTKSWTDDEIAKEIGLTEEEVKYIHEEMKDFGYKAQGV